MQSELSESKPAMTKFVWTFVYACLVVICVFFLLGQSTNADGSQSIMKGDLDAMMFFGITAAGLIFHYVFGASALGCLAVGSVGSFVLLTIGQEPLVRYLTLSALLFAIGMYGMVRSRNAVRVLMSIELMLNAVNLNLIAFARYIDPGAVKGQLFAIFILTVAAAEAAVGLAIVLSVYRTTQTVDMNKFNLLRW